ncbi:MAG: flagellar motor switch phosphatase FliY [Thermotogae bacterium]|nr:flagellar motor switch phosphatase FliY [Thermotogota bacterium]
MADNFLSQDEIDSLLGGNSSEKPSLSDREKDILGELGNISLGASATALSTILGKKVSITTPKVSISNFEDLKKSYTGNLLCVNVSYSEGLKGTNVFLLHIKDAAIIADLMMGGTGENPSETLDEVHLSAVGEAMNQMIGSASTSMSEIFKKRVEITAPKVEIIDTSKPDFKISGVQEKGYFVLVTFKLTIDNMIDSELLQIQPLDFKDEVVNYMLKQYTGETASSPTSQNTQAPPQQPSAPPRVAAPQGVANQTSVQRNPQVVQPVQFQQLTPTPSSVPIEKIDLLMDVPLELTVELGRTSMKIKDILELGIGSLIELDKLAGELVDILVNGKLIAKGEVVVVDENFGVRIVEIVSPMERFKELQ